MGLLGNVLDYFISNPLELIGLVSGLICVLLIIRQNIWNWPIGLLYAVVSVMVFYRSRLYSDVVLHLFYVGMNAYGWYYWLRGSGERAGDGKLLISRTPASTWVVLLVATAAGIGVMGWLFSTFTDADLAYWDAATTVMSFTGMWMTARKYIENWVVWLVVDVLATGIYLYKGIEPYAVLYGVYIAMAFWGWLSWTRAMRIKAPLEVSTAS